LKVEVLKFGGLELRGLGVCIAACAELFDVGSAE
jgi:hypothetical protein